MFKGLNEFLKLCFEAHGLFGFVMSVLSYGSVYLMVWTLIGYFLPWFLILLTPLVFLPLLMAFVSFKVSRVGLREFEEADLVRCVPAFVIGFILFTVFLGIPHITVSKAWFYIDSKAFKDFYFLSFIENFWSFWNHLNFFAKDTIPFEFYSFKNIHFQLVFWAGYLMMNPLFQWLFHSDVQDSKKARDGARKAELKAQREALEEEIRAEKALKQEKEALLEEQERARHEALKKEHLKKKRREVTERDPWESGFLG